MKLYQSHSETEIDPAVLAQRILEDEAEMLSFDEEQMYGLLDDIDEPYLALDLEDIA